MYTQKKQLDAQYKVYGENGMVLNYPQISIILISKWFKISKNNNQTRYIIIN